MPNPARSLKRARVPMLLLGAMLQHAARTPPERARPETMPETLPSMPSMPERQRVPETPHETLQHAPRPARNPRHGADQPTGPEPAGPAGASRASWSTRWKPLDPARWKPYAVRADIGGNP